MTFSKAFEPVFSKVFEPVFGPASAGPSFNPLNITQNISWWDAGQNVSTVIGDVDQWNDQSANANHVTQTTVTRRPLYDTTTDTTPFINFDGVDDFLEVATFAGGVKSQPITMAFVAQEPILAAGVTWLFDSNNIDDIGFLSIAGAELWQIFGGSGNTLNTGRDTNKNIYICVFNTAGTSSFYVNGGAVKDSGALGTDTLVGIHFASRANTGNNSNVNYYDFTAYDKLLSNAEINQLGNYFGNKHTVTWTDI